MSLDNRKPLAPVRRFATPLVARTHAQHSYASGRLMHAAVELQFEAVRRARPERNFDLPTALEHVDRFVTDAEANVRAKLNETIGSREDVTSRVSPYLASWGGERKIDQLKAYIAEATEDDLQHLVGLTGLFDFMRAKNFAYQPEGFVEDICFGSASCFTTALASAHIMMKTGLGTPYVLHLPNHNVIGITNQAQTQQLLIDWGRRLVPSDYYDNASNDPNMITHGNERLSTAATLMAPVHQSLAIDARQNHNQEAELAALKDAEGIFGEIALVQVCLARIYLELGLASVARRHLLNALKINPTYPRANQMWQSYFGEAD